MKASSLQHFLKAIILLGLTIFVKGQEQVVIKKGCHGEKEAYTCRIETHVRFGCCFKIDGIKQDWDTYDGISETDGIKNVAVKIEYCDPLKSINNQCNKMKELYKKIGQNVICAGLPIIKSVTDSINFEVKGRCRSETERKVISNTRFFGKKFYDLRGWGRGKDLKNADCDIVPYNERNIGALWDRFLLCPYDHDYLDREFNKLLEEAYYQEKMLYRLCLGTKHMMECKNVNPDLKGAPSYKCVCLQREWKIRRNKTEVYNWNVTQLEQGHQCSQVSGNPCTFNIKDLIQLKDTSSFLQPGEHSPLQLYSVCDVKSHALEKLAVLPDLKCEQDAACESTLKPHKTCVAKDDCKCTCSHGFKCEGDNSNGILLTPFAIPSLIICTYLLVQVFY